MNKTFIKNICSVSSSKRIFANEYTSNGIPFFRSTEIIELANKKASFSPQYFISKDKFDKIKNKYSVPKKGDILIAAIGANMGTVYYVDLNYDFYFKDGNVIWFSNFSNSVISKYLYYYLVTEKGYTTLCNTSIGSAQKALTIDKLGKIEFSFPLLSEQQHIVDIIEYL